MRPEQALLWYRRMAMLYALGSWWVLGSVIILTRTPKEQGRVPPPGEIGLAASASGLSLWKSPKRPSLLEPWGSAKLLLAGT